MAYVCQQAFLAVFAGRGSGPSAGPTMSLSNWLPPPSLPTNTYSAGEGSSAHAPTPHAAPHMHSMQSRQQCHAVPPQQHVPAWQQQHRAESDQLCGQIRQQQQALKGEHGQPAPVQSSADRKRRQCLLEIERELLRHSSSDDEAPPHGMQLPHHGAGKRRKAACTGGILCLAELFINSSLLVCLCDCLQLGSQAGVQSYTCVLVNHQDATSNMQIKASNTCKYYMQCYMQ